jgi:V/A-type H+-transporting ATPase subunit E
MAQELESLLERIQKEGVEQADARAAEIIAAAEQKARAIVEDAERKAKEAAEKAEQEGRAFEERGRRSLEQASRDLILSVGEALNRLLGEIVQREVKGALEGDVLETMLVKVVESYCAREKQDAHIEVLLDPDDKERVTAALAARFADLMREGIEVRGDGEVLSGFKVSEQQGHVAHDFTGEAIAESLCALLRPQLAEIVRAASGLSETNAEPDGGQTGEG